MTIVLDRKKAVPLYIQIKDHIQMLIERGSLKPNTRLPSTRKLASSLGVSRNVVIMAYQELESNGYIFSGIGSGTFVSKIMARKSRWMGKTEKLKMNYKGLYAPNWNRFFSEAFTCIENIRNLDRSNRLISFDPVVSDSTFPDIRNFKKSINSALDSYGSLLLKSDSPRGFEPLLMYLKDYLSLKGINCDEENIIVVNGTQQGLSLLGRLFIDSGDTVTLENMSYPGALSVFRALQANCIGIPINQNGIDLDILANVLRRRKVKLLYLIPTFHNPLGCVLPEDKREELLNICMENQVVVIEDDYANGLSFHNREIAPLKARDDYENVIYLGSFSETLSPAIRLSWVVAPKEIIRKLILIRKASDLFTNPILQASVVEYCRKGFLTRLIKKKISTLKQKSESIDKAMRLYFPPEVYWEKSQGGLYQWVELPSRIDSLSLLLRTIKRNVIFAPDRFFSVEEWKKSGFRLSFNAVGEEQIEEGIKIIGDELKKMISK